MRREDAEPDASSLTRCVCGETFDSHDPAGSYIHRAHI
jgi:hypothetical protein